MLCLLQIVSYKFSSNKRFSSSTSTPSNSPSGNNTSPIVWCPVFNCPIPMNVQFQVFILTLLDSSAFFRVRRRPHNLLRQRSVNVQTCDVPAGVVTVLEFDIYRNSQA